MQQLLGNLELFVAVGRTRSFSRAAQSLGLPTSTVSRRIAELERSLKLQLFVRTTRRVELTEVAHRLLDRCESIVEAAREARAEVLGLATHPNGLLRISIEADVGTVLIAPTIAELAQKFPEITVELDLSPRRVDLIAEGFDFAIRLGTLPDSSLVVRQIASLKVGLYAAPTYLKRHGTPRSPEELKSHSRLHLMHVNDPGNWYLSAGRRKAVVERRGALISANNMTMLRSLLRLGLGIGVMDQVMAAEDLSSGTLVRVLPVWSLPPVAVSLLTTGRLIPAKTRVFIDLLTQRFSAKISRRS